MANVDRPNGAKPVRHLDGSPYNGQATMYYVPSTYGTALYVGDFVVIGGTAGAAGVFVNGINVEGMPTITVAAAASTLLGVIVGFLPNQDNLSQKHNAASTARIALVADAPDLIFEMQEDSDTSTLAIADVGENVEILATAGSATTGLSAMEIDSSSHTASAAQLRLLRLVPRANNVLGANARWEVMINEHQFKQTAGT